MILFRRLALAILLLAPLTANLGCGGDEEVTFNEAPAMTDEEVAEEISPPGSEG